MPFLTPLEAVDWFGVLMVECGVFVGVLRNVRAGQVSFAIPLAGFSLACGANRRYRQKLLHSPLGQKTLSVSNQRHEVPPPIVAGSHRAIFGNRRSRR
jgi:hypothetical protein